ncbi:IS3 family transposase [Lactococcus lactis]|uniref:IS3 family transposase n=1 Tax=Lactococcus lactis TaxID=1358 RepID=UPI002416A75E|nr:IS3 family transposase [Lactococcus lactis]MDG4969507.1 IS3 family transposase [Lactococcus lactis]MDG5102744.1 IS3 family transposase [Lactococcus lactis]
MRKNRKYDGTFKEMVVKEYLSGQHGGYDSEKVGRAHQRKQLIFKTIDELCQQYSITRLCSYFSVSRSGYYAWKKLGKPSYKNYDEELASKILFIFNERNKGYRYIQFQLKRKYNITRNPKTILRYMRILNIKSPIRKKKYFLYSRKEISLNSILVALTFLIETSRQKPHLRN